MQFYGLFIGELTNWIIKRSIKNEKIITKEIFKEYKREFKPNFLLMILTSLVYIQLLHRYGIKQVFIENLDLIKFLILTPMITSIAVIDLKTKTISNRLVLTMFEIGLIFTFIYGISNVAISINMLLGMIVGAGIFGIITLFGGLLYGKEAMGLGDLKYMRSNWIIFWNGKYPNNNDFSIFSWSCNKYCFSTYKKKKNRRIHTVWTFYNNRSFYFNVYPI